MLSQNFCLPIPEHLGARYFLLPHGLHTYSSPCSCPSILCSLLRLLLLQSPLLESKVTLAPSLMVACFKNPITRSLFSILTPAVRDRVQMSARSSPTCIHLVLLECLPQCIPSFRNGNMLEQQCICRVQIFTCICLLRNVDYLGYSLPHEVAGKCGNIRLAPLA